jgi:hypothetical protein
VLGELTGEAFAKSTHGIPLFDANAAEELVVPSPGITWTEEQATRDFLAKWSELHSSVSRLSLKQLEPASKPVRFLTEFDSINTLLPQTQNMRSAARLLMLNGQVAIYDRNSAKTKLHIEALIGCSRTISGEPILVSQLVHIAIDSMGISLLRTAIEHDVLDEKDLVGLLPRILDGINIKPQWKLAMQGERAMMLPLFQHPELATDLKGVRWLPGRSVDTLHYVDFIDQILAVPDSDFDQFKTGLDKVEQDLKRKLGGSLFQKFDTILTGMMTPAVSAAGSAFIRDAVQRRMAALCIGIRVFEKRNGRMPTSLDDLKSLELGELRLEPASLLPPGGKPFGYRVEENKAVFWGFELSQASDTPSEPPPTADGVPNADINKRWIWTLEAKKAE